MTFIYLSKKLQNIENNFEKYIIDFQKHFLDKKYWDIFLEAEKLEIKNDWRKISFCFSELKKIRDASLPKWYGFFQRKYDLFLISYHTTHMYYRMSVQLHKTFLDGESFARQYLDDNFKENYSTIARYIYRGNFLYYLNYPENFLFLIKSKVSPELKWMTTAKKKHSLGFYFDYQNIYYHIQYRWEKVFYIFIKNFWIFLSKIRFKVSKKWSINSKCIEEFFHTANPGDILLSRKLFVATNLTIPGFWKHMAMYLWTGKDIKDISKSKKYAHLDDSSHYIIESTAKWVCIEKFENYIYDIDYLWVFRPIFSEKKVKNAIKEALMQENSKYDYLFNYYSQKSFVCSELITKAYLKKDPLDEWLTIELKKVFSGLAYPPNEFVKKVDQEYHTSQKEVEPILFIDTLKMKRNSFISSKGKLLQSHNRSRFSLLLP